MAESTGAKPALLFIPDISGFTQFVTATEISHSQFIIQELLETLIDANSIGMKVSEVEGDAILFYREGAPPSAETLVEQGKKMFLAFHQQLKKYERDRICNCNACTGTEKLTLKMVAHAGSITSYKVKDHEKLFGSDVILIHRLLKNKIEEHEYLLATNSISLDEVKNSSTADWLDLKDDHETYDAGEVNFSYTPLKKLREQVPEPAQIPVKIYRVKNPMPFIIEINAPMNFVYTQLIDLPLRVKVLPGILKVVFPEDQHQHINQIGTRHECLRGKSEGYIVTTGVDIKEGVMSFTETREKDPASVIYTVKELTPVSCKLTMEFHIELKFPITLLFNLTQKKKLAASTIAGLDAIKKFCEQEFLKSKN